jgi:multiple sugar transport system substrate-binding protein
MRKYLAMILAVLMIAATIMGCGNSNQPKTEDEQTTNDGKTTEDAKTTEAPKEREIVNYWHIHTGAEAAAEDKLIAAYNASQDKYEVVGLSMNDQQKLIVAMSGDEGPDVIFSSNSNLTTYFYNGLLYNLQEYFDRDKVDLTQWTDKAIESCTFDGNLYAIPESGGSGIQMYYNIDLLKAAGYSEPPKTMEELYAMAEKITTVDKNGDIDILGYPLFPLASARQELIYAFGGRWWDDNGNLTPQSQGIIDSLKMNLKFRKKYGVEKVQAFIGTAKYEPLHGAGYVLHRETGIPFRWYMASDDD